MRNMTPFLLVLAAACCVPAFAAEAAGTPGSTSLKIAVIDPMAAISGTEQFTKAMADLKKDTATDESKLTKLQAELNTCSQKAKTDGATMSATELTRLQSECDTKYREYQALGQTYQKTINSRQQAILQDMGPRFQRAVDAVAKEAGVDLVMQKDALLFFKPALEVTDKVTIKLNTMK